MFLIRDLKTITKSLPQAYQVLMRNCGEASFNCFNWYFELSWIIFICWNTLYC